MTSWTRESKHELNNDITRMESTKLGKIMQIGKSVGNRSPGRPPKTAEVAIKIADPSI